LLPPLAGACVLALVGFLLGVRNRWTLAALFLGGFTAQVTLSEMLLPVRQRMRTHGEGLVEAFRNAQRRGRRRFGAYVVHAGAIVVIVAIAVSSTMATSKEIQLKEGETATIGDYSLTFVKAEVVAEPHRESTRARMEIVKGGRSLGALFPAMNQYDSQREPVGTPAVRTSLTEDLYLSVHNLDARSGTVGLLVLVNPMVAWIWVATAIMALGGLVALLPALRPGAIPAPAAEPSPLVEGAH
jgi:cytochrome c-type biogenesis protein CcmF